MHDSLSCAAAAARQPLDRSSHRVVLRQHDHDWSLARLCTLAGIIEGSLAEIPDGEVALSSSSMAFLIAGVLAAWRHRRLPILLDPSLRPEIATLDDRLGRLRVLSDTDLTNQTDTLWNLTEHAESSFRPEWATDSQPAIAFQTSGSTGTPKTVVKKGYQLYRQLEVELPWHGLTSRSRGVCLAPGFHIFGFIYGALAPLYLGASVSFELGSSPEVWRSRISTVRPDYVVAVPSHYRFLLAASGEALPGSLYLCSGSPLDHLLGQTLTRQTGSEPVQLYGSTEAGGVARRIGANPWQPFPNLSYKIDDTDRLLVASAWQEDPNRWTPLDDLARDVPNGFELLGRADSVVKVGGKRISTVQISHVATRHPAVEQSETVVYQRYTENALALYVKLRNGTTCTHAELRSFLTSRLASFKVPRMIHIVEAFPLLSNGKTDLVGLRKMAATQCGRVSPQIDDPS